MSVQEKIAHIKDKAAKLAVKAAAVATLMSGSGAVSSCTENSNNNDDETKDKIENMEKTSVVFRSTHNSYRVHTDTNILTENGDELHVYDNDRFLEPGDTITYETDNLGITKVKAVRYKGNAEVKKKVDFGKIGKIGKDITD